MLGIPAEPLLDHPLSPQLPPTSSQLPTPTDSASTLLGLGAPQRPDSLFKDDSTESEATVDAEVGTGGWTSYFPNASSLTSTLRTSSAPTSARRPLLPSLSTIGPVPPSSGNPTAVQGADLPSSITLPSAPHQLSTSQLSQLPLETLISLIQSLSYLNSIHLESAARNRETIATLAKLCLENGLDGSADVKISSLTSVEGDDTESGVDVDGGWSIGVLDSLRSKSVEVRNDAADSDTISLVDSSHLLDLDNLTEAMSSEAFSFPQSLPKQSISFPSIGATSSDIDTPRSSIMLGSKDRRHPSLSSRLLGALSIGGLSISTDPTSSLSDSSQPPSIASEILPGTISGSNASARHERSTSIKSSSSASVRSVASSSRTSFREVDSKPTQDSYADWISWKKWSGAGGSEGKLKGKGVKIVQEAEVNFVEEAGSAGGEAISTSLILKIRTGVEESPGSIEGASAITATPSRLHSLYPNSLSPSVSLTPSLDSHQASPLISPSSSPSTSLNPSALEEESVTSTLRKSSTSISTTSPSPSILLSARNRIPSGPILTLSSSSAESPLVSVVESATLSGPEEIGSTPRRLERTLSSSQAVRTLSTSSSSHNIAADVYHEEYLAQTPSHFEAISLAASKAGMGSELKLESVMKRPANVGLAIKGLMENLLNSIVPSTEKGGSDGVDSRRSPTSRVDTTRYVGGRPRKSSIMLTTSSLSKEAILPAHLLPDTSPQRKKKASTFSTRDAIIRVLGIQPPPSKAGLAKFSKVKSESIPNLTLFPKLSTLSRYSPFAQPALSTPSTPVLLSSHSSPTIPSPAQPQYTISTPSAMELGTITGEAPPPTLKSSSSHGSKNDTTEPLVDRYGFVYDVRTGMKLLRESRSRKERRAARGGEISEAFDSAQDNGEASMEALSPQDQELQDQLDIELEMEGLREALGLPAPKAGSASLRSIARSETSSLMPADDKSFLDSASSSVSIHSSVGSPPNSPLPQSAPLPVIPSRSPAKSTSPKAARIARTLSSDADISRAGGATSMKRLLGQLTEMHDAIEKTQREAWDSFIGRRQKKLTKQRSTSNPANSTKREHTRRKSVGLNAMVDTIDDESSLDIGWSENLVGVAQMGAGGKSGRDDWEEFKSLVRKGIPIAHRPKVWAECSGSNELREPGVYQDLLSQHREQDNPCVNQIDMDCHRTFPTNVFFAGNGPGVAKLRNVLIAYSWRNPAIGYCQGMNNLTATLLLTHPAEEDAFWVLVCMIEKILPSDYYTSHLLVSQADQRVLRDIIQRHLPEISAHLEDLGVELPAITFGWFLSLFTDALPIQTLLRIWDLLFVFGTVILFRIAVAIIQMNSADILACDSASSLYALIRTMTTHLYQVDKLLKVACEDLKPIVRDREISQLRTKHVADLRMEMGLSTTEEEENI